MTKFSGEKDSSTQILNRFINLAPIDLTPVFKRFLQSVCCTWVRHLTYPQIKFLLFRFFLIRPRRSLLFLSVTGKVRTRILPITGKHSLFLPSSALQRVMLSLRLAYSRYRPPWDSVGFTLLSRLVFCFCSGAVSSAVGIVFTRSTNSSIVEPPTYLLVRAYQPDLAL
jgi:hypothetical protein